MPDEPIFMAVRDGNPEFQRTIRDAQASLPDFRRLLEEPAAAGRFPNVKTRLSAGERTAFVWLLVRAHTPTGFVAEVFEIPPEFEGIAVGDRFEVPDGAVMDWMLNDAGSLHGGFSLRYQRAHLPPERHAWFDEYIGVERYL